MAASIDGCPRKPRPHRRSGKAGIIPAPAEKSQRIGVTRITSRVGLRLQ
jgi:hypothetical protein